MELTLNAQIREKKEKIGVEYLPAVMYGAGAEAVSLKIKRADLEKTLKLAGESNLITLSVEGKGTSKVLLKDIQRDQMKNALTHADFYIVNMKEKITTEIPLHFVGESKAVRELGGMLMKEMTHVEVECLPDHLVDHIDVEISPLNTYDDMIRVSDLQIPKGLEVKNHGDEVVANIMEPKQHEEEAPAAAPVEAKKEEKKEEKK